MIYTDATLTPSLGDTSPPPPLPPPLLDLNMRCINMEHKMYEIIKKFKTYVTKIAQNYLLKEMALTTADALDNKRYILVVN